MEPHELSQAEIRDAILRHGLNAQPSIQFGDVEWLFQTLDPTLTDRKFQQNDHRAWEARQQSWHELNLALQEQVADVAHDLFVSGLMRHTAYYLTSEQFNLTNAGRALAVEGVPLLDDGRASRGIPEDVLEVWREAVSCYPARLRATAILLGVAAEMVITNLAGRLKSLAPPAEQGNLGKWQISSKRQACLTLLRNTEWRRVNGVGDGEAKGAADALEMLGTLYSWIRDENAHARSVQPPRNALYAMLNAFPDFCHRVMSVGANTAS
jgi:hypothetical protein